MTGACILARSSILSGHTSSVINVYFSPKLSQCINIKYLTNIKFYEAVFTFITFYSSPELLRCINIKYLTTKRKYKLSYKLITISSTINNLYTSIMQSSHIVVSHKITCKHLYSRAHLYCQLTSPSFCRKKLVSLSRTAEAYTGWLRDWVGARASSAGSFLHMPRTLRWPSSSWSIIHWGMYFAPHFLLSMLCRTTVASTNFSVPSGCISISRLKTRNFVLRMPNAFSTTILLRDNL